MIDALGIEPRSSPNEGDQTGLGWFSSIVPTVAPASIEPVTGILATFTESG